MDRPAHQIPGRFIFSLGTLEPRKNTAGLIRAFNILKSQPGFEDLRLLIGGSKGWKCGDVFKEIKTSPYSKDIQYLGYMAGDRSSYYSSASVFIYPSFFEGFGLPVLEAMSCGIPVVTSATSSMPEVAGDGALLINPYNISAIAKAIETILNNPVFADILRAKALAQSELFDWEIAAQKTLAVIHRE